MDKSIWIGVSILTLLTLLFVVHVSHPTTRSFLTEGFAAVDYTKPAIDLTTEPDFMAFYKFHTDVCVLWNGVIDETMKNDCVDPSSPCPAKPVYIKNLQDAYILSKGGNNVCFIQCEKAWNAKSPLIDLLAAVPMNIDCYSGTLQFVIDKTTEIINQANDALSKIGQGFADYKTTIHCKPGDKGITQCTDDKGDIYILKQAEIKKESQTDIDLALKQKTDTNTIIGRCRTMVAEIPDLKQLMKQATKNVETLKTLKKKAENGELIPQ